ncbi:MAG: hypothetical protein M1819_001666 [Sarea resinae]|nr:MAG: hypothetical protein M1819_001666 [Sarea resinae]
MSATPPNPPLSRAPNGVPPPFIRRPKAADPLVRPKKRLANRRPAPPGTSASSVNGIAVVGDSKPHTKALQPTAARTTVSSSTSTPDQATIGVSTSGFSEKPEGSFQDYPLFTTKRALLEGLRHHIAKFASKKNVDPRDESQFTRPVRLQRRDPRAPPAGAGAMKEENNEATDSKENIIDDKEKERQEIARAEREAQREANLAQIAPSANTERQKKANTFNKKKTQQVFRNDQTKEGQAEAKLRYEEALPWHLEDFDNKNTWVGNYEAALSDTHAILVMEPTGVFRMVPLEKWYKFTAKAQFKTLNIDEAEDRMTKKVKEPRWFMDTQRAKAQRQQEAQDKRAWNKLYVGKANNEDTGVNYGALKSGGGDVDDLDFVEDRFADDEENQLFEGDEEENKEAEERIKRDQLQANIFNLKDEKDYDKAEKAEQLEKEMKKKLGKRTRKALMKRERNYNYTDDSDENPYSEESESEDTEAEKLKEEEAKKKEEEKAAAEKEKAKSEKSGTSTKGTTTPSGKDKKDSKKAASALKRPGSPNLSEASGTETAARKKHKKHKDKHGAASQATSPTTTAPGSRPMSPAPEGPRKRSSIVKIPIEPSKLNEISSSPPRPEKRNHQALAGSGSEGDGTAGDLSDGANKRKKIKLRVGGSPTGGSPQGSRAGSPEQAGAPQRKPSAVSGSRAGSPVAPGTANVQRPPPVPVSKEEIVANLPEDGITISALVAKFKGRIQEKTAFIALVRSVSSLDSKTKLLKPKRAAGSPPREG